MSTPRVLVIVPALNEQESLPAVLDELRRKAPGCSVLVVDDGSRDQTAAIARAQGVPVVSHAFNLGVGGALQTGFRWAMSQGYDIGVQVDADGQHDPAEMDTLMAPVLAGECDVCIGSRYAGEVEYRAPFFRRVGILLFAAMVRLLLRQRLTDTTSGFRAYNRAVMEVAQHDLPRDFPDAPLLLDLARRGFRLAEVPVAMRARQAGRSQYTFSVSLYYPYKNLLACLMVMLRRPA